MNEEQLRAALDRSIDALMESTGRHPHLAHLDRVYLPSREHIIDITQFLRQLVFPGYFGEQGLSTDGLRERTQRLVIEVAAKLNEQLRHCMRYRQHLPTDARNEPECETCDEEACDVTVSFFERLPKVREFLAADVQAAFQGDPAAKNPEEPVFSYPGLLAISVQRLAHEFYRLDVPLLPRIMTEWAHSMTGIDIHPGAQLGRSFFIDHGTGVVVGETTLIGNNVKIYQGVTLGALAPAYGQMLRGQKRHPTIEDDVTIYSGATILGGETTIGRGCTIGGNVFVTSSVPPFHIVSADPPHLKYRDRRPKPRAGMPVVDFQI